MRHTTHERFLIGLAYAMAILITAGCSSTDRAATDADQSIDGTGNRVVAAYHPWWTQSAWEDYDADLYDELYFFSVDIDSSGSISGRHGWPDRWFDLQRTMTDAGTLVTPVVTLFSQRAFEQIFSSEQTVDTLTETLLALIRDSPQIGGLQIDFEIFQPVPAPVRARFSRFMVALRAEMNALRHGLRLSVYVVAYDESDVYDEAALAAAADYLVVQGYDLHSRGEDRTGPLAGLAGWGRRNWQAIVARLDEEGVPRGKIVMSVPYFGYEWPAVSDEPGARTTGTGTTIAYARVDTARAANSPASAVERAAEHGLQRDPASGSPYYVYRDSSDDASWRQGWFEDAVSLEAKYRYVIEEGLGGVAIFPAAYGTEELERVLRILSPAGRYDPR